MRRSAIVAISLICVPVLLVSSAKSPRGEEGNGESLPSVLREDLGRQKLFMWMRRLGL